MYLIHYYQNKERQVIVMWQNCCFEKNKIKERIFGRQMAVLISCFMVIAASILFLYPTDIYASTKVSSLKQIEQIFQKAVKNEKNTIAFTSSKKYTSVQLSDTFQKAAKSQNRLLSGSMRLSIRSDKNKYEYEIYVADDALMKIKILKSRTAAVKAAAEALKKCKYTTNYYSDNSYYEVFQSMLQEHPEYNYDTSVWKNSNGAYGYRGSASMTKKQQKNKMEAADQAAAKAVKECIKKNMSDKQKAKAVHDYIIRNCMYSYSSTQDCFTAYGALVNGSAVCQGYAAAFNLMAAKCGLQSMAVCGVTRGGAHAWTYVKIGSKYRYIDCTWDDTDDRGEGIVYTYFVVVGKKMREEHDWDEDAFPSSDIKYIKYLR